MTKEDPLIHFNKYIIDDITAEDAMGSCCLDGRCEKKESED